MPPSAWANEGARTRPAAQRAGERRMKVRMTEAPVLYLPSSFPQSGNPEPHSATAEKWIPAVAGMRIVEVSSVKSSLDNRPQTSAEQQHNDAGDDRNGG